MASDLHDLLFRAMAGLWPAHAFEAWLDRLEDAR